MLKAVNDRDHFCKIWHLRHHIQLCLDVHVVRGLQRGHVGSVGRLLSDHLAEGKCSASSLLADCMDDRSPCVSIGEADAAADKSVNMIHAAQARGLQHCLYSCQAWSMTAACCKLKAGRILLAELGSRWCSLSLRLNRLQVPCSVAAH